MLFVEQAISYLSQILPGFCGGGNLRRVQYAEMEVYLPSGSDCHGKYQLQQHC